MRISDWSSDVCSSDLEHAAHPFLRERVLVARLRGGKDVEAGDALVLDQRLTQPGLAVDDVDEVVDDAALAPHHQVEVAEAEIEVDDHRLVPPQRQPGADGGPGGGLADAALSRCHADQFSPETDGTPGG